MRGALRPKTAIVATSVAMLVCGCAVGPDFHRPAEPKAMRYTEQPMPATLQADGAAQHFAPGAKIPQEWWGLFHSRTLDALVRNALNGSPTLDAARATLTQANEDLAAELGYQFPQVDLSTTAQRQRFTNAGFGGNAPPNIFNLYNASVKVSYGIDLFGGLRRQIESQKAQVEYANYQFQGAVLALTANVVTAAVTEASLREQIRATQDIIASEEKQLGVVERQFELGGVSKSDVLTQKSQLAQTRATLPPLEKSLYQVRHQLAVYAGKTPQDAKLPAIEIGELHLPEELPLSLPSELARQRPDIRAAEALLHEASAQVGVATANLYPQISLSANLGSQSNTFPNLFTSSTGIWSISGNLLQPIFHGGELEAKKKSAIAAYDKAFAQYRTTVLQSFQNVADVLRALESDAATLKARSDAESSSREALDLVRKQFSLGAASYLSLLTAERQYQQNHIGVIEAKASRMTDSAALFQALGGGWWNKDKNGDVSHD